MADTVVSLPNSTDAELATLLGNLATNARLHTHCAPWCPDWHNGGRCTRRVRALACIDAILEEQTTRRLINAEPLPPGYLPV